jgi:hypothetical protein
MLTKIVDETNIFENDGTFLKNIGKKSEKC